MDKVYIKNLIQDILNKEFGHPDKRRIVEYHDRFNYACPICSDSKDNRKKRGNLYLNRLYHICFNCGAKLSLDRMCRKFNQTIDPDKKLQISEYLNSQVKVIDYQNDINDFNLDYLINLSDVEKIFKEKDFSISDFEPVREGGLVSSYLKDRNIVGGMLTNIYQAKYWYTETRYENIICFLNRRGNKILSIQIRNLKQGKKRMFKIYNYETLYKWVNSVDEVTDIDLNQLVILNKLSYYFNILNINFELPITIFEGYLDSIFFPNSIGIIGVNTSLDFLESNSGLELRYFFDNDIAGHKKSDEKIRNDYPCFLWKKLFDTIVSKKRGEDPYKLMHRISKVKDLNELCILVPNAYRKFGLNNFFSKDKYDLSWIPKPIRLYK